MDFGLRAQVIERLRLEFGDWEGAGEIPRIVDEVLAYFGEARIQSFLPILVLRRAREAVQTVRGADVRITQAG